MYSEKYKNLVAGIFSPQGMKAILKRRLDDAKIFALSPARRYSNQSVRTKNRNKMAQTDLHDSISFTTSWVTSTNDRKPETTVETAP